MLGFRLHTNGMDFIHPSMVLVHRFGLLNKRSNRLFIYLLSRPRVIALYEFYELNLLNRILFENISNLPIVYFFHDNILNGLDYYRPQSLFPINYENKGFTITVEFLLNGLQFLRNETNRQIIGFSYIFDFNNPESFNLWQDWPEKARFKVFKLGDSYIEGFIENNIDTYFYYISD